MIEDFREFCIKKNWQVNCFDDFKCIDGDLIEAGYASLNLNNYMLLKPLNEIRTSLKIPFQSCENGPYLWRVFLSRTYIAGRDWWKFSNDEWSIYCTKAINAGDLCIKFGFGSLIANQSIKSLILRFLISIDTSGISFFLDPTQISASDIVFGAHDAKKYGGIKGVVDILQNQLASMIKEENIEIQASDWIIHPGSGRFTITIPYEFQDAS